MNPSIEPLYDKQITCTFCSTTYPTKKVRSRFTTPVVTDSDFCTYYKVERYDPVLYNTFVCPSCGFTSTDQFSPWFPPGTKREIKSNLVDKYRTQDFSHERSLEDAIHTYKLAVYTATLKKEKSVVLAGLYLRLVWLYRKLDMKEQEKRFMRLTVTSYERAYSESDRHSTEMNPLKILYLIGECKRRLGEHASAVFYFSKVIQQKNTVFDPKIVELARDQWYQTREDQKLQRSLAQ
ncbi:hypothetical protein N781_07610 [Pontibacillus halophilus JSM 076056 = DSM 19796]|uniref:DUF2225 domain-containing protein n=1 Tax=Pontibacillus halophilus JSM 076056 = DSM 19796 TaxID=1385510 RepID=A0A0A5GET0_9BACI|nr:DUF2225 domain-containing protein [Pontibacillus halophilus]KGX89620.1 hypothetical protein N781_07610 [Pontibacillus halophilus JSM 076056 = DSM 19796]